MSGENTKNTFACLLLSTQLIAFTFTAPTFSYLSPPSGTTQSPTSPSSGPPYGFVVPKYPSYKVPDKSTSYFKPSLEFNKKRQASAPSDIDSPPEEFSMFPGPTPIQFSYLNSGPPKLPTNKIYMPEHYPWHESKPHGFEHPIHIVTDAAGQKLQHVGAQLSSGELNEQITYKLAFAKAAILQLLGILAPLSAYKTLEAAAHSSAHHGHHGHEVGGPSPEPHFAHHHHHAHTPIGLLLNVIGSLSHFTTETKLHIIPNLVKMVSYASASSSGSSSHSSHPHH